MATDDPHVAGGVRLQKVLAQAGLGSRRACEALIAGGRVSVDGAVVTEQGVRVDPASAVIHVDGLRLVLDDRVVTYAFHKPRGVLSAMDDPQGRRTLAEFTDALDQRVYHVGRLDHETEGLLLLSNDGELAHRLTHPSFEVPKTYVVTVPAPSGGLAQAAASLRAGITLEDGPIRADEARVLAEHGGSGLLEITLHSGRNRIVRRMIAAVGLDVERLVRTRVGTVRLDGVAPGEMRRLGGDELGSLLTAVGL